MKQTGIFCGRVQLAYDYGRFGWTRGGGKVWHGGVDLIGVDDRTIRMPYYNGKKITGTVTRARIVTDKSNKTWEWGWYVCVKLDANRMPSTTCISATAPACSSGSGSGWPAGTRWR